MFRSGHQAVNYANARQISDFYGVSDILGISTPKALQFIYVLNIKLNSKVGIFEETSVCCIRLLSHLFSWRFQSNLRYWQWEKFGDWWRGRGSRTNSIH